MSTFTENYSLIKPDEEDYYDVADFNENMDTIDTLMAETETEMANISNKIGTPEDTSTETIFGLLNNGGSLIKSIQHVTFAPTKDKTSGSVSISTVDPARCIVIMERLKDTTNSGLKLLNYTLNEDSISITHDTSGPTYLLYGFWVIEFY